MAEIKSTLDLVMERTKNLTLTSTEKQAQKDKENENRIKGLVQKLLDGLLTDNQLMKEYGRVKDASGLSDDSLLVKEILSRVDPDQDNQNLLVTLEECCRFDTAAIRGAIKDYRSAYNRADEKRSVQLKDELAQKYSITGSAVTPNLEVDEKWQQEAKIMRRQFEDRLNKVYGMANAE